MANLLESVVTFVSCKKANFTFKADLRSVSYLYKNTGRENMASKKSMVAVLKTKPESILEDYEKVMEMGGLKDALKKNKTTILKDNISWHFPFPGANSTPWQMEGTIKALKKNGFDDITCVQNKTVVTNAFKGEDLNKYLPIFKKYEIPVLYNFKEEDIKWEIYKPKGEISVLNKIFPEGILIPESETTGAMKNAFGGLLNTRRHYTHSWIHETLVDLLTIQKEIHSGLFAVMDGTTAGNGPGPRTMIPEIKDIILASEDQVAIDAVAAKMMGFDPMSLKYIRLAHEKGLGIGKFDEIEIVGEDVKDIDWGFSVGDNAASKVGDMLWFGPLKILQKLFFHTPLVWMFIFGSEFYHDNYRWPKIDKPVFEKWKAETHWGKMFEEYEG